MTNFLKRAEPVTLVRSPILTKVEEAAVVVSGSGAVAMILLGSWVSVMPDLIRHPPSLAASEGEGGPRIKSGVTTVARQPKSSARFRRGASGGPAPRSCGAQNPSPPPRSPRYGRG